MVSHFTQALDYGNSLARRQWSRRLATAAPQLGFWEVLR